MNKFKELGLSEGMIDILNSLQFDEPTDIQKETIPLVLQGKDVIGSSATGSGKTLAFGAGLIDMTKAGGGLQTLILTPTRELAEQVTSTLRFFSSNKKLRIKQIYGGVSMSPQINDLKNAEIVVGTPGRLLDHLERKTLNLFKVKYLVLDEADRMLDMGFIKDVEKIIRACPNNRQTLLFSATMSKDTNYVAQKYMKNPIHVSSGEEVDPSKLYQIYYDVSQTGFDYIHRIGRTARAGKNGIAVSFVSFGDHGDFNQISKQMRMNIEKQILPKFDFLKVDSIENNKSFKKSNF